MWNSPFSPQGSTPGGKSAKKDASSSRPAKDGIENARIDADGDRAETQPHKFPRQFTRVALPDGKQRLHANLREIFLAVDAQVFKENIAERHAPHAPREVLRERFLHALFVGCVDALRRNQDRVKRQAERFGLPLEQRAAHAVHADAVVLFGNGREQRGDAAVARRPQRVQRHRAVFPAAPAEEHVFRHASLTHGAWCISRRCETRARAPG